MGTKTQETNWSKRFESFEQPSAGYRLMLLPPDGRSRLPRAEFWHHTIFWERAEAEDRYFEIPDHVAEWEQVALTRERFPESFKQAVKTYVPQWASFWIDCIEIAEKEGQVMADGRPTAEALAEDIGVELPLR